MDPLSRLKQRRTVAAPKHSAALSHVANGQYMDDWERAYAELAGLSCNDDGGTAEQPRPKLSLAQQVAHKGPAGSSVSSRQPPQQPAPRPRMSLAQQLEQTQQDAQPPARMQAPAPRGPVASRAAGAGGSARGRPASTGLPERCPSAVTQGWQRGPVDPQGILCDLSDRPNMCSAAHWGKNEVVIGSSDHALYVIDAEKGVRKRTLYNKTNGHSEWVTCCTYTSAGHVVSGGMDSRLWFWPGGVRGVELQGHSGPISQVKWDDSCGLVASASYDKTLRLWDVGGSRPREVACLMGHAAPVLEMTPQDGQIVSGDRSGNLTVWDAATGAEAWRLKKRAHDGHVTSLEWWDAGDPGLGGCFVSGGQDGCVRVWDPRQHTLVTKLELHVNEKGRGATSDLCAGGPSASGMCVSAGADGTLAISDPRASWGLVDQVRLSNFPYSLLSAGGLAIVGLGDGSVWVVDCSTGQVRYCLGANKHAVRCLEATHDRLVTSGDDGNMVLYTFD